MYFFIFFRREKKRINTYAVHVLRFFFSSSYYKVLMTREGENIAKPVLRFEVNQIVSGKLCYEVENNV